MFALAGNLLLVLLVTAHVLFATLAFEMATGRNSIPAVFAALFIGSASVAAVALFHRHATPDSQRSSMTLLVAAIAALVAICSPIQLLMSSRWVGADFADIVRPWTPKPPGIDYSTIPGAHKCAGINPGPGVY